MIKIIFFTLIFIEFCLGNTNDIINTNATYIMQEVYKRSDTHKYQKFDISMYIFDKSNKKRERYFESFKQITSLEKKSLIKFYKPVNIKNTSLLNNIRY